MNIPPEKIVELLSGSASGGVHPTGGTPGELALTRVEMARAFGVNPRNEAFRELIRSMTAAGYVRREHRPGGSGGNWVYVLGRPLDDPDRPSGPTPGFTEDQSERARADVERLRQTPRGARPGGAGYTTEGKLIHGVNMPPNALCGRNLAGIPTDIPLRPGADLDLLNQRETQTSLLDDITCPGCVTVRASQSGDAGPIHGIEHPSRALCGRSTADMQPYVALLRAEIREAVERYTTNLDVITCSPCIGARHAARPVSPAPQGRRPGRIVPGAPEPFDAAAEDVVHGANRPDKTLCFVPTAGMPEFDITVSHGCPTWTANLDIMTCAACLRVGDDPTVHGLLPGVTEFTACGDIIGDLHNPRDTVAGPGERITCYPCRDEISSFEREADRRREAADDARNGLTVHLADSSLGFPVCPVTRPLPPNHSVTVFPSGTNCRDCIAVNGGHTGPRGHGYNEGREAAAGDVDTSRRPEHNYVQGLASRRQEIVEGYLAAARAEYEGRCTYAGSFNSEHPYENVIAEVAQSRMDNDGYDEWERCAKLRTDVLHVGQPEADDTWLAELFEFERCHECGQDANRHRVTTTPLGGRFAQCVDETGTPLAGSVDEMDSGPAPVEGSRCSVSAREYGTPHSGPVRPYRASDSNGRWMICDGHLHTSEASMRHLGHSARLALVDVDADEAEAHDLNTARNETDAEFFRRLFAADNCQMCGRGADGHRIVMRPGGYRVPECISTPAGPCTYNRLEVGGPHAFTTVRPPDGQEGWDTCGQPRSHRVHSPAPVDLSATPSTWPVEQASADEVYRRQAAIREQGLPTGFDANPGDTVVHVELGNRGTLVSRDGECAYVRYPDTTDNAGDLTHADDLVVLARAAAAPVGPRLSRTGPAELDTINIHDHRFLGDLGENLNDIEARDPDAYDAYQQGRHHYGRQQVDLDRYERDSAYAQGVRDCYVAERKEQWRQEQAPTGWTPPAPRWTARTFQGEPAGYADEAEEAWRHRVERIDHWRRNGRLTDNEATALLTPMSPGGAIADEEAWRRNGTSGRFDPVYVDAVEQLSLDADNGHGVCRYCGEGLGAGHAFTTGTDGNPRLAHPPWNTDEGTGTYYDAPGVAAAAELVPGDPVTSGGRHGIFEYLDDSGMTAFVTFEGTNTPEQVPAGSVRAHGATA